MGPLRTLMWQGIRRRRMQGGIIAFVLLLATLASTVALDILVGSRSPFDTAFAAANGAHLAVTFDGNVVSASDVASTAHATGVTGAAGPWPVAQARFLVNPADVAKGLPAGFVPGTISARDTPVASVDQITLLQGRWWQAPGEVVLSRAQYGLAAASGKHVGDTIDLANLGAPAAPGIMGHGEPATVTLRIVGVAASISTPDVRAWLSPADLARFVPAGEKPALQMLYRVANPTDQAALAAARGAIEATLPQGAVVGATTWLALRTGADLTANLMVPILLAFAAFAFLAAAFIVVNVVSGVIIGSQRQIGLLKAIGATPQQVTAVLLAQVLIPAAIGSVLGTVLGALASQPILGNSAAALGVPALAAVSPVVLAGVPATAIAVTLIAALGPSIRGSRLATVKSLTRGATPAGSRGAPGRSRLHGRSLPGWLPSSVALGLRRWSARPLRTAMTFGALVVGVSALAFTLGMEGSLRNVGAALFRDHAAPVRVEIPIGQGSGPAVAQPGNGNGPAPQPGKGGGPAPAAPYTAQQVDAIIASQPATERYVAIGEADVVVPGLANPVPFFAYRGDSSWLGYVLTDGRWFAGLGEVVVPDNFLIQTGLHVGDDLTASSAGASMRLTIVGSVFDQARCRCNGPRNVIMRGEWATLAAVDPSLQPSSWEVASNDLMSPSALAHKIRQATNGYADASTVSTVDTDEGFLLFEGVIASLGAILVLVAVGGVANTVLLESRERLRETAILRAVGMTPRQVVTMVVASVVPLGVIAAILGAPIGAALQRAVIVNMGQIAISSSVPSSVTSSLGPTEVAVVVLGGLAIALAGAWLPSGRTARAPIAPVLQAE